MSICEWVSERVLPVLSLGGVFPAAQINGLILDINPSIGKQTGPNTATGKGQPQTHTQAGTHTQTSGGVRALEALQAVISRTN